MLSTCLWNVSSRLRRHPLLLPCAILAVAFTLVIVECAMFERDVYLEIFLIIVLTSMLPLAYVDAQLSKSQEPIAIFHQFGLKVLLMHTLSLGLRSIQQAYSNDIEVIFFAGTLDVAGVAAGCVGIAVGFRHELPRMHQNSDVFLLVLLACITAFATLCVVHGSSESRFLAFLAYVSDYVEVLAFVPAAWTTFNVARKDEFEQEIDQINAEIDAREYKLSTLAFSLPVAGFYVGEDLITGCVRLTTNPFESTAHILHFLLLADLCVFVIASAFDPSKHERGTLLTRITDILP